MIRVYASDNPVHKLALEAFFAGCPEPKEWRDPNDYGPSDVAVVFGTFKRAVPLSWPRGKIIDGQKLSGGKVVVIDSGYVRRGDQEDSYYACGLGGLNGRADFRNADMPPDRWAALGVPIKPWSRDGSAILLCGQVPWDASVQDVNMGAWLKTTAHHLRMLTDRPILYRPHPLARKRSPGKIEGCQRSDGPLEGDMKDAWAVVTYNSNAGVDAVLCGKPNFCLGGGSMTNAVSNKDLQDIESPLFPDREQWAHNLAYAQWTPQEMRDGKAWGHLFR